MKEQMKPTEAELEILQILWSSKSASVREVHDELSKHKESGYTTTLKIMQLMHEKGMVTRVEQGRHHVYRAAIEEETTQNLLLSRFIDRTFMGSASKLVMQTLGNQWVTKDELDEIKELLKTLEDEK
jgi:BlaI family penicillinase repressor